jgi:hypothetical protein
MFDRHVADGPTATNVGFDLAQDFLRHAGIRFIIQSDRDFSPGHLQHMGENRNPVPPIRQLKMRARQA